MSEQNTDREALGDIIDDWLTDPDHIDTGFLADAILNSEWLADLIRRERGAAVEQRAADTLAALLAALLDERDRLAAKLDAVKAIVRGSYVISGEGRDKLLAILADTDEGDEQ